MNRTTYDPEKETINIARFKHSGNTYEVSIDPEKAISFREGKDIPILDIILYEKIFADAQRGHLAPENSFEEVFKTKNKLDIARIILEKGDIHITAEHRKRQIERKKKQIIQAIHKRGVDPKTKIPHTEARIALALEEAKIHVDEFKAVDVQIKEIIKKLQPILPIRFEVKQLQIVVDVKYAQAVFGYIKNVSKIIQNMWNADGSWTGIVEIPGGIEMEVYDALNSMSHGSVHIQVKNE